MLIRVSGGSSGITDYLKNGQKSGREYTRDELDQRVLLSGSINDLDSVLNSFDPELKNQKYLHITLSFKESDIDEDMLRNIDAEFHDFLMAACAEEEFYYYSEAHLPKLKHLPDKKGREYERFPHIHVVVPEYNLYTAKRENPLNRVASITHYIDAFQERINDKYELASPKDNIRDLSVGRESIINRYELKPDMSRKQVKEKLFDFVRNHPEISSVDELALAIKPLGEVKVRESKKFGSKYINFAFDDNGVRKAINLKDGVFLDTYLATRDKNTTRAFIGDKYEQLVQDWRDFGALEARFVEKASKADREGYFALDKAGQKGWLDARWSRHLEMISVENTDMLKQKKSKQQVKSSHKPNIDIDEIPHVDDFRHVDDIQHMDDFRHLDDIPDVPDAEEYVYGSRARAESGTDRRDARGQTPRGALDLSTLRQRGSDGSGRTGQLAVETDILSSDQRNDMDRDKTISHTNVYVIRDKGELGAVQQYSGVITKRHDEHQQTWTAKINSIDARTLLDYLSYQYKLDTKLLTIARSKNGADRIVVGARRYSAADYLTKQMNLSWPECKVILTTVLERQKDGGYAQQAISSKLMWARYQRHEAALPGLAAVHKKYRDKQKQIKSKYKYSYDHDLTQAQNVVQRRLLSQQRMAEIQSAREQWLTEQQYYRQSPNDRYLQWLHNEAEQGSRAALGELNRVYPEYRNDNTKSAFTIHIKDQSKQKLFAPFELGYNVKIKKNGTVEYLDTTNKPVISDTYKSIKVHDRKAENIKNALELAKARFGVNGFEIRNATQADLKAIQDAVNKAKVNVTIVSDRQKQER